MRLAGITNTGVVRRENQDDYRASQISKNIAWGVVCDGMGGARGGKVASRIGCDSVQTCFTHRFEECTAGGEDIFLADTLQYANSRIYETAKSNSEIAGMGTTAVCVLVRGRVAHLCHAGDSRGYLLRGRELRQLTHDHSYVQELVDGGMITPQEAEHHPQKNIITRVLGVEPSVRPEYTRVELQPGDILLLCSDGLSNAVSPAQMLSIVRNTPFYDAPGQLIDAANQNGGPDNITALLIELESEASHG